MHLCIWRCAGEGSGPVGWALIQGIEVLIEGSAEKYEVLFWHAPLEKGVPVLREPREFLETLMHQRYRHQYRQNASAKPVQGRAACGLT